jgi:hypothetical protein
MIYTCLSFHLNITFTAQGAITFQIFRKSMKTQKSFKQFDYVDMMPDEGH